MTRTWTLKRAGGWFAGALLVLLHLLLALLLFDAAPFMGGDNAVYISLARALADHGAYVDLYDPARPIHTQFPPVFPAMIAVAMTLGVGSLTGIKLMVVACSVAAVAFSFAWLRGRTDPLTALALTALLALSPGVALIAHWELSDVPFWMFTMLALWQWERYGAGARMSLYVAIAATVLAYFTRAAGLPLAVAAAAWLVSRRDWKSLAVFAAVLAPLALIWSARASGSAYANAFWYINPYFPEGGTAGLMDILQRVPLNLAKYTDTHLPLLGFGRASGAARFVSAAGLGLAFAGWAMPRRKVMVADLFLPLYIGLLLVWPAVWSGERLLLPVLPLLVLYAANGLRALIRRGVPFGRFLMIGLVGLQLGYAGLHLATTLGCNRRAAAGVAYPCKPAAERDFLLVARWARSALPDSAVVISRKPSLFWLIGGRPGEIFPLSSQPADLLARADSIGARYMVLDPRDRVTAFYAVTAVTAAPGSFCMLNRLRGTMVLGILAAAARPAADPSADMQPCALVGTVGGAPH